MAESRLAFRCWLARRSPFVIGLFYGLMAPGYIVANAWLGWWRGINSGLREWRNDFRLMLAWHRAPIYDQFRTPEAEPHA